MNTNNIFSEVFQWPLIKRKAGILGALFPSVGSKPLLTSDEVFCVWRSHLTNSARAGRKTRSTEARLMVSRKSSYLSRLAVLLFNVCPDTNASSCTALTSFQQHLSWPRASLRRCSHLFAIAEPAVVGSGTVWLFSQPCLAAIG